MNLLNLLFVSTLALDSAENPGVCVAQFSSSGVATLELFAGEWIVLDLDPVPAETSDHCSLANVILFWLFR